MDRSYPVIAKADGTCQAVVNDGPPKGLVWVIAQISIETTVFRAGATAVIRRDGRFVANSSLASSDTAYGPPPIMQNHNGAVTCDWAGLTVGDQAIMTIFYDEQDNGAKPNPDFVV